MRKAGIAITAAVAFIAAIAPALAATGAAAHHTEYRVSVSGPHFTGHADCIAGTPCPIESTKDTTYIASAAASRGKAKHTITTARVITGVYISLAHHLLAVHTSHLDHLKTLHADSQTVQLPQTSSCTLTVKLSLVKHIKACGYQITVAKE